jgi:hypothetical protein
MIRIAPIVFRSRPVVGAESLVGKVTTKSSSSSIVIACLNPAYLSILFNAMLSLHLVIAIHQVVRRFGSIDQSRDTIAAQRVYRGLQFPTKRNGMEFLIV